MKHRNVVTKLMVSYSFTYTMIELADTLSVMIDGIITSRNLGTVPFSAIGLTSPSYFIVSLLSGLFAVGMQNLCSFAMGSSDSKKLEKVFSSGTILMACISLIGIAAGYLCIDPLCVLLGADRANTELFHSLQSYLRGWFVGIPGFMGFTLLSPIVSLDGNKKCVTIATVVQSVINIAGDFLSVKVFNLGTFGIGFFTGFGFDIALLILIGNFFRKKTSFHFKLCKPDMQLIYEMLMIGSPRLTKYGCKILAPILINRTVMGIGGVSAMAAMAMRNSVNGFFLAVGNGISESVNLIAPVLFSEKDKMALHQMVRSALSLSTIFCSAAALLLFILAKPVALLFMEEEAAEFGWGVLALRCLSFSLFLNCVNACVQSYLQGTRKIVHSHAQMITERLVSIVVLTYALGKMLGTRGLFFAIPGSELFCLLFYVASAFLLKKDGSFEDRLLLLDNDIINREKDMLSFKAESIEQVTGISEQIISFCTDRGIDYRRAYFAALCMEEVAGNVVLHGFTKDRKKHNCEMRVVIEEGDILLTIRDDCRYFNMKERYEAMKQAEIGSNVGIRLVYGIAKSVDYVNMLNLNSLMIRV